MTEAKLAVCDDSRLFFAIYEYDYELQLSTISDKLVQCTFK